MAQRGAATAGQDGRLQQSAFRSFFNKSASAYFSALVKTILIFFYLFCQILAMKLNVSGKIRGALLEIAGAGVPFPVNVFCSVHVNCLHFSTL